ncbi:MAG TPA: hypothetical protein VIQ29_13955 [Ancylobacter sp.]
MPTAERLREDIDRGLTGDKVPFRDPAAAPLGTDDEAAGMPPTAEEVELARATEMGGDARNGPVVTDERSRDYDGEPLAQAKASTSWPRGRGHNWRAAFMLIAAVVAMSAVLSIWHALS